MSIGWSYSPIWTGQRGGDWPQPLRRHLRLQQPAAKNGPKRELEWPHSSGLKREVDWPNPLKMGVAWPFSRHPEENWHSSDWDNGQTDWPKTFTSKAGGQKYITDKVEKKTKTKQTNIFQAAARWAAADQQYSSAPPRWWREKYVTDQVGEKKTKKSKKKKISGSI